MKDFVHLNEFIAKHKYELWEVLTYNSYGVKWARDSYRPWESISVSEMLWLIIDPWMHMAKTYYPIQFKEACDYGTKTHKEFENYNNGALLDSSKAIHVQKRLAMLKENIEPLLSEQTYSLQIWWIPIITWTVDVVCLFKGVTSILDYKTSKKKRNFFTVRNKLQGIFYEKLSWIIWFVWLYLNQKDYTLQVMSDSDREYYGLIVDELLEYTVELFKKWKIKNLVDNEII